MDTIGYQNNLKLLRGACVITLPKAWEEVVIGN